MTHRATEPESNPVLKGGTDGANFHGRNEYIPVESLRKMVEVLVNPVTEGESGAHVFFWKGGELMKRNQRGNCSVWLRNLPQAMLSDGK